MERLAIDFRRSLDALQSMGSAALNLQPGLSDC